MKNSANRIISGFLIIFVLCVLYFGILTFNSISNLITKRAKNDLAAVNVVNISGVSYDAVVCPIGSIDNSCTHFGATGMQNAINNAPVATTTPYKIFIKNGEYKGFVPVERKNTLSGGVTYYDYIFFLISNKNVSILGESAGRVILDGTRQFSSFFLVLGNSSVNLSNLKLLNISDIRANSSLPFTSDLTDYCLTDKITCYYTTGVFFYGGQTSKIIISNTYAENGFRFGEFNGSSLSNIYSSQGLNMETLMRYSEQTTGNLYGFKAYNIGSLTNPFTHFYAGGTAKLNIYNSVFYLFNKSESYSYLAGCLEAYDNSEVIIQNSLLSNCYENGVVSRTPNMVINNSMIINNTGTGVRLSSTGKASVSYSYVYNDTDGKFSLGVVQGTPPAGGKFDNDPQIYFDTVDIFNPLNFTPLTTSRSKNGGDPAILNVDGTRSTVGPAGGPNACYFKSDLPGCGSIPTPSIIPTSVVATIFPQPSTTPVQVTIPVTPGALEGDLNKDSRVDVQDVIYLLRIVFK